ncbi:hypothetical protein [Kitasatospora sp. NPDC127116]|uniref:hypothetical protein n=1 Tax=Kitasatospora sp. NPDC127116 TaxID=3345367 RepID=UPI00362D7C8F
MPTTSQQRSSGPTLREVLLHEGYFRLLLVSGLVGVPVSLAAFGFVSLEHELQQWVWESLPETLGHHQAPWWWPLPALLLAGLLLAPIVTRLPGHGGHIPVDGFGGPPTMPVAVPGVVLAALACLPLGVVLALVLFKGLGWSIALGGLRGGPIFPALLLGTALGTACAPLPGFGAGPALAVGLAASGAAVTGLPVTSTVLAAALLGGQAADAMPLLIVSTVAALITAEWLRGRRKRDAAPAGRAEAPEVS